MFSRPCARNSWMRSSSHSWLRNGLVWLLCLCAWRGPVPVVHCHDLDASATLSESQSDWQLAQHMSAFHSGDHDHLGESGWHVHFVMPSPSSSPSHDSDVPSELPLGNAALAELVTQPTDSRMDVPMSGQSPLGQSLLGFPGYVGPFDQPCLEFQTLQWLTLCHPRATISRLLPRIFYCVAQC